MFVRPRINETCTDSKGKIHDLKEAASFQSDIYYISLLSITCEKLFRYCRKQESVMQEET